MKASKKPTASAKKTKPTKKAAKKTKASPSKNNKPSSVAKPKAKPVKAKKTAKPAQAKKAAKKKKKGETLMCFLTTACVRYFHLSDQGYELNTLRRYRDSYLASTSEGRKLISDYYQLSPEIVAKIEKDPSKQRVYSYIFDNVRKACREIESSEFVQARETYKKMVETLQHSYQVF